MLILALDCSTSRGSVAIGQAATLESACTVLWERIFPAGRGHGGELFSTLQQGLRAATAQASGGEDPRLGRVVVGLGPGSYSGVRQAIAVATGLSLVARATLAGLPSPLALETTATAYHAIGDARRGTFYYTAVDKGVILEGPALLDSSEALLARFAVHPDWPVLAVEAVPSVLPADFEPIPALPLAARLLMAGPSLYQVGILEPIYLRPPAVTLPKQKG